MRGLFAPSQNATKEMRRAGEVREFKGSGTPYLKVPGLKSVMSIRVGLLDLPLIEARRYPANNNFEEKIAQVRPLVSIEKDDDGTEILMRSLESNDGVWQDGITILIAGVWAPVESPEVPASPEPSLEARPERRAVGAAAGGQG